MGGFKKSGTGIKAIKYAIEKNRDEISSIKLLTIASTLSLKNLLRQRLPKFEKSLLQVYSFFKKVIRIFLLACYVFSK